MKDLNKLNKDAISLYVKGLEAKGYSKQEIAAKLSNVGRFMQWAYEKDHLQYKRYQHLKDEIAKFSAKYGSSAEFSPTKDHSEATSADWASPITGRGPPDKYPIGATCEFKPSSVSDKKPFYMGLFSFLSSLNPFTADSDSMSPEEKHKASLPPHKRLTSAKDHAHAIDSLEKAQQNLRLYVLAGLTLVVLIILSLGIYDQFFRTTQETIATPSTPTFPSTRTISFQGRLTDSLGNPITTATDMRFRLYDASTGGTTLYDTGTCSITPDQDGVHNVLIGSDCGSGIDQSIFTENAEVWLGVTVGTDSEMTPRQQIANVGYALNAETLQGLPPGSDASSVAYINDGGDMLISSTSPQVGSTYASETFLVSSANAITIQSAGSGDVNLDASGSGELKFLTGGAQSAVIANGGNFGLGVASPTTFKLEVAGNVGPSADSTHDLGSNSVRWANVYADTYYGDGSNLTGIQEGQWQLNNGAISPLSDSLDVLVGSTATTSALARLPGSSGEDGFVISGGNFGFGTRSPTALVDLPAATSSNATLRVRSGSTPSSPNEGDIYADGTDIFYHDGSSWIDLTDTGISTFLGLTDTPGSYTSGSILFTSGSAVTEDNSNFYFDDGNDYLGIGTNSVDYQLDVVSDGTNGAAQFTGDSVTTGNVLDLSADGLTTGNALNIASTSTALTSGRLATLDWSPGSSTTATGDLFRINIGANGDVDNLLHITDNGSTVFSVSESGIESAVPHSFTAAGDVTIAYDLNFSNQTSSNITSSGPFSINVGEVFESNNLTLNTYNSGDIILDAGDSSSGTGTISFYDSNIKGASTTTPIEFANASGDINTFRSNFTDETIIDAINETFTAATGGGGGLWTDGGSYVYTTNGEVLNLGGITGTAYHALSDSGTTSQGLASDDDLYVEGDFETDGTIFADGNLEVTGTSDLQGNVSDSTGDFTIADNAVITGTTDLQGNISDSGGDLTVDDNLVVTGTSDFQGNISDSGGNLTLADDTDITGALTVDGNTTLGDASGDTVTSNAANWTFANDTSVTLSGGVDGLNFDNDTLSIDAANDKIGIGTAAPVGKLEVNGAVTGKALTIFNETGDQDILTASASGTTRANLTNAGQLELVTDGSSAGLTVGAGGDLALYHDGTDSFINTSTGDLSFTATDDFIFDDAQLTSAITLTDVDTAFDSGDTALVDAINTAYGAATGGGGGLWTDSGTTTYLTTTTDDLVIGGSSPLSSAKFSIDGDADQRQLVIQGNSTQTQNLTEWQDSGGNVRNYIGPNGNMVVDNSGISSSSVTQLELIRRTSFQSADIFKITQDGTTLFSVSDEGNLGVGTAANALRVANFDNSTNPLSSNSVTGMRGAIYHSGNPSSTNFNGTSFTAFADGSNASSHVYNTVTGFLGTADASGDAPVTDLVGSSYITKNSGGAAVTNMYGVRSILQSQYGTQANYYGFHWDKNFYSNGITNAYGLYISDVDFGSTSNYAIYTNAGDVRFGDATSIIGSGASDVQLTVKGAASQSANLTEWTDSSDNKLAYIESDGELVINQDSKAIKLGAGQDANIYYDSTNLVIDPKVVGSGYLDLQGDLVALGDVAANGGDITSSASTFNLLNSTPTTLNIGGAATTVELGAASGTTSINNALTVDGNTTLGDAGADTVTSNAASWTFANDTAVTLSGGVDGLNFDSNTLSIDAANDRLGVGTASPDAAWIDIAAATASKAQINLTSSAATDVSSPGSGDLWWNGTNLYFYDGSSNNDLLAGGASTNYWQLNSNVLAPGNDANVGDALVLGGNTTTNHQFDVTGAVVGKALALLDETGDQNILTASASGTTRLNLTNAGQLELLTDGSSAGLTVGAGEDIALYHDGVDSYLNTSTGDLSFTATDDFIFDDAQLTSAITLTDVDTAFDSSDTGIVDAINTAYGAATGGGGGLWTDGGSYVYPSAGEVLGNSASAGSNKIAGLYLGDSSPLYFGADNDINYTFSGSELAITTGNNDINFDSNTLFVDGSADRVGIGTNTPVGKLDVNGAVTGKALAIFNETGDQDILTASASGTTRFRVKNDGTLTGGRFEDISNTTYFIDPALTGGTGLRLAGSAILAEGGSEDVVIGDTSAEALLDVGGGTATNIDGVDDLLVADDLEVDGTIFGDLEGTVDLNFTEGSVTFIDSTGSIAQDNSNFFWDDTDNKLGVGNASPVGKLDVSGAVTGKALAIFNETGDQDIFTASASGTTRMTLTNDGNLGLGTSNPGTQLELATNSGPGPTMTLRDGDTDVDADELLAAIDVQSDDSSISYSNVAYIRAVAADNFSVSGPGGKTRWEFGTSPYNGPAKTQMTIDSTGYVGIGTKDPTALLHVNGSDTLQTWTSNSDGGRDLALTYDGVSNIFYFTGNSNESIHFQTNGNDLLKLTSQGLVGIGSASPVGKLDVSGAVVGKALGIFNETGDQDILTASASGTTRANLTNAGQLELLTDGSSAGLTVGAGEDIALYHDGVDSYLNTSTGDLSFTATDDFIFDDAQLTSAITLTDVDTAFDSSDTAIVDAINTAYGAATGGGGGLWTDGGSYVYPSAGEVLGNSTSGGSNKITGLYLGDSSPLYFGADNDVNYSFSGSELAVTTGNNDINFDSNTLFVDGSANNVGIGNSSPSQKLDVSGGIVMPTGSSGGIYFDRGGTDGRVLWKDTSSTDLVYLENPNDNDILFRINGTEILRVDNVSGGRVGISDTSAEALLDVGGGTATNIDGTDDLLVADDLEVDGTIFGSLEGSVDLNFTQGSVTFIDSTGSITQDNSNFFWDDTNDKLGIGSASPVGKLDVTGAITGKALAILNEAGDQNILTASASGTTRANLTNAGQLELLTDGSSAGLTVGAGEDIALYHDGVDSYLNTSTGDWNMTATDDFIFDDAQLTSAITLTDVDTAFDSSDTGIVDAINTAYSAATGGGGGLWTDSGTTTYLTTTTDDLVIGGSSPLSSAKFSIDGDADQVQLIVQGNGTQTSDLAVFENSTGTDVFTISNAGNIVAAGTSDLQGNISDSGGDLTFADNVVVTGTSDLQGNVSDSGGDLTIDDNLVVTGTSDLQGNISDSGGNLTLADAVDITGALTIDGNTTLGDAGADTVTSNAANWTFANDTSVTLSGGVDGLNFDSNTLSIDAANDKIGIGTAAPVGKLDVDGAVTGKALAIFNETGDQDILTASASGTTRFRVKNDGTLVGGRFEDISNTTYFIDPAATGQNGLRVAGSAILAEAASEQVVLSDTSPEALLDVGGGTADNIDGIDDLLVADDLEVDGTIYGDGSNLTGVDNYVSWSFATDGTTQDAITSGDILDFASGSDIDITRSADDQITVALESTLDTVSTINLSGTGTLNALDSVDATTEDTIEALIFDADAENISGVWEVQDNTNFAFGNDANWTIAYDETTDDRLEIVSSGALSGDNDVYFDLADSGADSTYTITNSNGTYEANLSVEGDVTGGTGTFGNIQVGLTAAGEIDTSSGNLTIDSAGGTTTVDDALVVTGTSDLQGNVSDSGGDLTFADNVIVTGTSDFQGNISDSGGDLTISDNLVVTGTSDFQGNISDSLGNLTLADAVDITGALTVDGNTTLGDAATDTVTFNADIASHLVPSADDTYAIGSNTARWSDIYLGPETIHIGTSTSDEATIGYTTSTNTFTFTNNFGDTDFSSTSDGFNFTLGGGAGDDFIVDTTSLVVESDNNRVGIGTAAPAATLDALSTTEQLRLSYDASNYISFTVDSGGDLDLNATGNDITTPDRLTVGSSTEGVAKLTVTGAETGKALTILNETGDQNILVASDSGTGVFSIGQKGDISRLGSSAISALPDQGSMAPNASFELDNDGSGYPDDWADLVGSATYAPTGGGHGEAYLKINSTTTDSVQSTCFPVSSSQSYSVSMRARNQAGSVNHAVIELYAATSRSNCESSTFASSVSTGTLTVGANWGGVGGTPTSLGSTARWGVVRITNTSGDFVLHIDGVRVVPSSTTTGLDLAETYPVEKNATIEPGHIVQLGQGENVADVPAVSKTDEKYDNHAFGVVATQPGLVLDDGDNSYEKVKVALAGRVPVQVTTENGPIRVGDAITASSLPGIGMRSTKAARVIGRAMTEWNHDDPNEIGTVTIFVEPAFDAGYLLTDMQNLLKDTGNIIKQDTVKLKNLVANSITAATATIDTLIVDRIVGRSATITEAEITDADIERLNAEALEAENLKAQKLEAGEADINNLNSDALSANKASIAGTLIAQNATVEGNLTADNIDAKNIRELRERLEKVAQDYKDVEINSETLDADVKQVQEYITELTNTETSENLSDTETYQLVLDNISLDTENIESSTGHTTSAVNFETLTVTGTSSMTSLTVADAFSAADVFIKNNTISSLTAELKLSALERVDIMNGAVTIAEDGTIRAKGEVIAEKGVRTDTLKPVTEDGDVSVVLGERIQRTGDIGLIDSLASGSSELQPSQFKIQSRDGNDVASIDASGSAKFNKLALNSYREATSSAVVIASRDIYRQTGIYAPAIKTSSAASGNGILPAGENDILIFNDNISEESIINLTATSSTNNHSMYVDKIETCSGSLSGAGDNGSDSVGDNSKDETPLCSPYFRVAIDNDINRDVTFNWLLVN